MTERELLRQAMALIDHARNEILMGGDRAALSKKLCEFCEEHQLVLELLENVSKVETT